MDKSTKTRFQSGRSFEEEILLAARKAVQNPQLSRDEILEWAFGEVTPQSGEIAIALDAVGCNICLRREHDKRLAAAETAN